MADVTGGEAAGSRGYSTAGKGCWTFAAVVVAAEAVSVELNPRPSLHLRQLRQCRAP